MADVATYPKRENHFAHRYVRLLTRSAAALHLGGDVCWMLSLIAHQEDTKRYQPVNYWNEQLMNVAGVRSVNKLIRMRKRAVAAGWLHYHSGGKYAAGVYWVLIPEDSARLPDGACDESSASNVSDGTANGTADGTRNEIETKSDANQTASERKPSLPNPIPPPNPKEGSAAKRRFTPPTVEEVRAYCKERANGVKPERFIDYYEARGWRTTGGPVKDWKACVRTWEGNGDGRTNGTPGRTDHRHESDRGRDGF